MMWDIPAQALHRPMHAGELLWQSWLIFAKAEDGAAEYSDAVEM
jgi:hypothetical protein